MILIWVTIDTNTKVITQMGIWYSHCVYLLSNNNTRTRQYSTEQQVILIKILAVYIYINSSWVLLCRTSAVSFNPPNPSPNLAGLFLPLLNLYKHRKHISNKKKKIAVVDFQITRNYQKFYSLITLGKVWPIFCVNENYEGKFVVN